MFSRIGKAALKPDLSNTIKLCEALGNPQTQFRSIHIAGTNGKGSVSHGLSSALNYCSYKTGLYTSPHLVDFRERIRINGEMVSEEWVIKFVEVNKNLIEEIQPSFFEITVAMAFQYFAEQGVDVAVIETGLGGRLDSTNIITPVISIITNISYDHKDLLGDTLGAIAAEKAGIIKQGIPVVIGEQHPETERVFFEHAIHKQTAVHYADSLWGMVRVKQDEKYQYYKVVDNARREMFDMHTDLRGAYQQHNLKTIFTAAEMLSHRGFNLPIEKVCKALEQVKRRTGLKGRWDILQSSPLVVCDVAHNPAGLAQVLDQFSQVAEGTKHILLGFVSDKDVSAALDLFPGDATYYFTNANIQRALPAEELSKLASEKGLNGRSYSRVTAALEVAKAAMNEKDALLITGSFFIVGEVLETLENAPAAATT
ncbi:MAG: bifunctional folylpolyglutamate synthase/dihydrofolate synthase [Taibaiella sp.]|nr:bifunctional folylpolyglutamate synthase/dihydrofolate synthase [Taibaiella sp.]